jgi:hypothetical protein
VIELTTLLVMPKPVAAETCPVRVSDEASARHHHKALSFRHFRNVLSREIGFESRQLSWSTQRSVCGSDVGLVNIDPEGTAVMFGLAAPGGKSWVDTGRFSPFYDAA